MQLTVGELIEKLQKFPPHMLVVRGDADWGNLKVDRVDTVYVNDTGAQNCWEVFDAEIAPDPEDNRTWMVKIS